MDGNGVAFSCQVPPAVLSAATASRAYIYRLEAIAQLLAVVMVTDFQFDAIVCFVDNTAAEHALAKGHSKDSGLSWLNGSFWHWVSSRGLFANFQRVTRAANLADKISRGDPSEALSVGCSLWDLDVSAAYTELVRLQTLPSNSTAWDFAAVRASVPTNNEPNVTAA